MAKKDKDAPREEIVDEFERRFLVIAIDPDVQRSPSLLIEQGYFEGTDMRVRITDDKSAELTRKTGKGRARKERNLRNLDLTAARFLFDALRYKLTKRRHLKKGWEVDYFQGPLQGLVIAEFETK